MKLVRGYGNKEAGCSLINLDRVAYLKPLGPAYLKPGPRQPQQEAGEARHEHTSAVDAYECFTDDGRSIGRVAAYLIDEYAGEAIVPNTSDAILLQIDLSENESDLRIVRLPIVAWRILIGKVASPISTIEAQTIPEDVVFIIEHPRLRSAELEHVPQVWEDFRNDTQFFHFDDVRAYALGILKPLQSKGSGDERVDG